MMCINNWFIRPGVKIQQETKLQIKYRLFASTQQPVLLLLLPSAICYPSPCVYLFLTPFIFSSFPLPPSLRSFSAVLRASTHIKWRAAVRFQFRTHLWCCRPPTRSAVAEGTQGSPITALYANVLAPGQQRGHAGTRSLFMQISGRQSQHNTEPATDTGGHISPPAQKKEIVQKTWKMWTEWQEEDWSDKVKEIKKYMELVVNKMHEWYR